MQCVSQISRRDLLKTSGSGTLKIYPKTLTKIPGGVLPTRVASWILLGLTIEFIITTHVDLEGYATSTEEVTGYVMTS